MAVAEFAIDNISVVVQKNKLHNYHTFESGASLAGLCPRSTAAVTEVAMLAPFLTTSSYIIGKELDAGSYGYVDNV